MHLQRRYVIFVHDALEELEKLGHFIRHFAEVLAVDSLIDVGDVVDPQLANACDVAFFDSLATVCEVDQPLEPT